MTPRPRPDPRQVVEDLNRARRVLIIAAVLSIVSTVSSALLSFWPLIGWGAGPGTTSYLAGYLILSALGAVIWILIAVGIRPAARVAVRAKIARRLVGPAAWILAATGLAVAALQSLILWPASRGSNLEYAVIAIVAWTVRISLPFVFLFGATRIAFTLLHMGVVTRISIKLLRVIVALGIVFALMPWITRAIAIRVPPSNVYWYSVAILVAYALLGVLLLAALLRARVVSSHVCPTCSYDLRATTGACPPLCQHV